MTTTAKIIIERIEQIAKGTDLSDDEKLRRIRAMRKAWQDNELIVEASEFWVLQIEASIQVRQRTVTTFLGSALPELS